MYRRCMILEELQFRPDPARKLSAKLYDIYHCCVCSEKLLVVEEHVEFYSKNKFEKLVHLVGFIIRIYRKLLWPSSFHEHFFSILFASCVYFIGDITLECSGF